MAGGEQWRSGGADELPALGRLPRNRGQNWVGFRRVPLRGHRGPAINFATEGRVIDPQMRKARQLMDAGMTAVVYCGSMGDWPLLTDAQRMEGVARLVAARIPVIVGTGAVNSRLAVEHATHAAEVGAAGLMVIRGSCRAAPRRSRSAIISRLFFPPRPSFLPSSTTVPTTGSKPKLTCSSLSARSTRILLASRSSGGHRR